MDERRPSVGHGHNLECSAGTEWLGKDSARSSGDNFTESELEQVLASFVHRSSPATRLDMNDTSTSQSCRSPANQAPAERGFEAVAAVTPVFAAAVVVLAVLPAQSPTPAP